MLAADQRHSQHARAPSQQRGIFLERRATLTVVIYVDAGQMPAARQPGSMRTLEVDVVLLFLDRRVCVNHCGSSASPEESYRGMSTVYRVRHLGNPGSCALPPG